MTSPHLLAEVLADADTAARYAAALIAAQARRSIAARGRFTMALSGGSTPRPMLGYLAAEDLPWERIAAVQVDERVAPIDSGERNIQTLRDTLGGVLGRRQIYPMPVENDNDLNGAARDYGDQLNTLAGTPPVIDLIHLGLGGDGHTASLTPADAALDVTACDVTATGVYQGRRRLTLTYRAINNARRIVWFINGASKAAMLARLLRGDTGIPAGRVRRDTAVVVADKLAASYHAQS